LLPIDTQRPAASNVTTWFGATRMNAMQLV